MVWPAVAINELACHGEDFVELAVASAGPVDLGGWYLTDDPDDPAHRFTIPAGTTIDPGTLAVFTKSPTGLPFGIKCASDVIRLFRPDGQLADQVALPQVPALRSWGRFPDGSGVFCQNDPTPGQPNRLPADPQATVYDPFVVPTIDLGLSEVAVNQLGIDPHTYVQATFSFTDATGTTGPLVVGVHLKGMLGSFRPLTEKAAFRVSFDHVLAGQRFRGLARLMLNNLVQDPSMIHEALTYRLGRALGLPLHRVGYAWVRVNGQDYGLYANVEVYDAISLGATYPSTQHLYEGGYGLDVAPGNEGTFSVDEGKKKDFVDLMALAQANATAGDDQWVPAVSQVADLASMRKVWALEQFVGHWDGYAPTVNNYYLHSDSDGVFTMLTSGADQTWAAHLDYHQGQGELFRRCMRVAACRQPYDVAVGEVLSAVDAAGIDPMATELAAFLQPWVEKDPRRPYSFEDWKAAVQGVHDFVSSRVEETKAMYACILGPDADPDGDNWACGEDCAPDDPAIHPFAPEICDDGIDQDCTGVADDGPDCPCPAMMRGPHRYRYCTFARTWDDARANCQSQGADLVIIDGPGENAWLLAAMAEHGGVRDVWQGLSDTAVEGVFVTVAGNPPAWTLFAPGEPNDWGGNEDCVELYGDGTWNDLPCSAKMPFVCEDACAPDEDADQDGFGPCGDDCDDSDPAVHPGAKDLCGDGIDQDCDGVTDGDPSCSEVPVRAVFPGKLDEPGDMP